MADEDAYTTKVWHGRVWVYLQSLERGQRIAIPLKGSHLSTGALRILLQPNGQVEIHHAADGDTVCSTRPYGAATVGVDKGYTEAYTDSDGERHGQDLGGLLAAESDHGMVKGRRRTRHHKQVRDHLCQAADAVMDKADTIACEDLSASMKSAKYRHKDTNRRLHGWVKGVMADTLTSISRRRGSALALVNPACTSQIDSRTGLLQGHRRWDRFYCCDGAVRDADINAACNIPARLYDGKLTLYMPYREVRALLAERTRTAVGTARPGLELRRLATPSHQPRAKYQEPTWFEE